MQWEYKSIRYESSDYNFSKVNVDNKLNEQGNNGWELVSTTKNMTDRCSTVELLLIFKRPKQV